METQQKQETLPPPPPAPPAAAQQAPEQQSQPSPAASTTRQRILAALRRPAVPITAVALLAVGCIAAYWATGSSALPAADEAGSHKKSRASRKELADLRVPRWMSPGEAFPSTGKQGEDNPDQTPKKPATPDPLPTPAEPPRYLDNPAVADDISLNHPDAVTDREIATKGWVKLSAAERAWVIRRTRARALAYRNSLVSAHEKFIARIWPTDLAAAGQRRFLTLDANLRAAVAAADGQLSVSYETANAFIAAAKGFLEDANASWLAREPVTLPDFEEKPNPAWRDWQSRYGRRSDSR